MHILGNNVNTCGYIFKHVYYIGASARGQDEAKLMFALATQVRKCLERTYKVHNFWSMSAMQSQKAAEDS